jgi:hypothetical protein
LDKNKVLELCMDVRYKKSSVEGQTPEQRRAELNQLFADLLAKGYERSKIEINEIIKVNIDQLLPSRVEEALGVIAEIATVGHGQKKEYWVRNGKITAAYVALGAEIRRQKIYKRKIEVTPFALGGSVYIEYDDLLSGRAAEYFTNIVDEIVDAIMEEIMGSIETTFVAAMATAPALNQYAGLFNLTQLRSVCNTIAAYGNPVIIGTNIALANITSDNNFRAIMSDNMKDILNRNGFIGTWEGKALVNLPNSFTDTTNTTWQLSNNYLYVVPVGQDKVIKITFEGDSIIPADHQDFDTLQITKKVIKKTGINILQAHNIGLITIS